MAEQSKPHWEAVADAGVGALDAAEDEQDTRWTARLGRTPFIRSLKHTLGKVPKPVWAVIFAVLVVLYPIIISNGYWIRIGGTVALYTMLGVGLNVVAGYTGLLDMGYTAFYGIGAYTYAILASPQFNIHINFWVLMPITMMAAILLGVLIGSPTLRVRGDYLAIVTLAMAQIFQLLLKNLDRPVNITNGPNGIVRVDPPKIFGFIFSTPRQYFYLILFFAVVTAVAISRLRFSRVGRAWAGIRDDEITISCMGVNRSYYKVLAYVTGAGIAGLAGGIFASWQQGVFPENFGMSELIAIYTVVVIGGAGSPFGVVMGSIGLVYLGEVLRPYGVYRMIIYSLILLLMMRFRPQGIIKERPRRSKTTVDEALAGSGVDDAQDSERTATDVGGGLLLKVEHLSKAFGGIVAVNDLSFEVRKGEILGVIGPNGAGKTTVFNLITGLYKPDTGVVTFMGKDITAVSADKVANAGMARTFQGIRTYQLLSVLDNVMVGAHSRLKGGVFASIIKPPSVKRAEKAKEMQALQAPGLLQPRTCRAQGRLRYRTQLRRPPARGDLPRHAARPTTPSSGRTCRRHEPGRGRGDHQADPRASGQGLHHHPGGASDARGHARVRPAAGDEQGQNCSPRAHLPRSRSTKRSSRPIWVPPAQTACGWDRAGLPWSRGIRFSHCAASTPATGTSGCSRVLTSTSMPVR